jgi:ABC-type polysaccharide/polyol phosphate export permease
VSKSFLSGLAILIVAWALGLSRSPLSLWILAVIPVIGLAFGALALAVTALARSYDFFMYYFTLVVTPMAMLCGVFFPTAQLLLSLQAVSVVLFLFHATELVRPLILGEVPANTFTRRAVAYVAGIMMIQFAAGSQMSADESGRRIDFPSHATGQEIVLSLASCTPTLSRRRELGGHGKDRRRNSTTKPESVTRGWSLVTRR